MEWRERERRTREEYVDLGIRFQKAEEGDKGVSG